MDIVHLVEELIMEVRPFIASLSYVLIIILVVSFIIFESEEIIAPPDSVRFIVASDLHFGQEGTNFSSLELLVNIANEMHKEEPFDFLVLNGDLVENNNGHLAAVRDILERLDFDYYVTMGNHEYSYPHDWATLWGLPLNHQFSIGDKAFLFAATSNEKGQNLCPDRVWLEETLSRHEGKGIFIFMHINPTGKTRRSLDCEGVEPLFVNNKGLKAVFNGHDHDLDRIIEKEGIYYAFSGRLGGKWGTAYYGARIVEITGDIMSTYMLNVADPLSKIDESSYELRKD